jgi:hypothetical protein
MQTRLGHAKDVRMMWMILQADEAEIAATGKPLRKRLRESGFAERKSASF